MILEMSEPPHSNSDAWSHEPFLLSPLSPVPSFSNNPLTPKSDQDRIPPYNINTISSRQVMRMKKNIK